MKAKRVLIILVSLTLLFAVGLIVNSKMGGISPLLLLLNGLIGIFAIISIFTTLKKVKEEKEGQPMEDELTTQIRYKAGYEAYVFSLYMWLFIFLLKDIFPDTETMIGGGILLSALIGMISKIIVKQKLNEK